MSGATVCVLSVKELLVDQITVVRVPRYAHSVPFSARQRAGCRRRVCVRVRCALCVFVVAGGRYAYGYRPYCMCVCVGFSWVCFGQRFSV